MSRCLACGYDLGGSAPCARCPECGTASTGRVLTGGLAGIGALSARPAARVAISIAALLVIPLAVAILGILADPHPTALNALLHRVAASAQAIAVLLGAYLCVLVARMVPADSPWHRMLWIVMAARILWGCALLAFAFTMIVPYTVIAELPVMLAADLLLGVAVLRIAPTGGLSNKSFAPALVATVAAGYGMAVASIPLTVDPSGITTWILRSGAVGGVACAVALWRIDRELRSEVCQARATQ